MAKSKKFTAEELEAIRYIQEERGTKLSAAVKYFRKHHDEYMRRNTKAATAPARDFKAAAANDKTDTDTVKVPGIGSIKLVSAPKAEPKTMTPEERGKARAEGLRLFKLAGAP